MNEEIWRDIEDYEGYYQISNLGRIKSLKRYKKNRSKLQVVNERILKQNIGNRGYYIVILYRDNNYKIKTIHRLIMLAFIPNPFNKRTINHKDGNKLNNNLSNLEWATYGENMRHAIENGLIGTRKKVVMLSLENEPLLIFDSQSEASRMSGIGQQTISACCNGKRKSTGGYRWQFYKEEI